MYGGTAAGGEGVPMRLLRPFCIFLGSILAGAALSGAARAAELWIQPEPLSPQPGQEVRLRLFRGEPFAGEEQPFHGASTGRFQRIWKSGRANLKSSNGSKPVGRFRAKKAGVQLVAFTPKQGGNYCKAVIIVGKAEPGDPLRWSEVGHRLEIVPQTDPVLLAHRGGDLEVQVLLEREPLAGVRVRAHPAAAPANGTRRAVTDEIGLATLKLDRPGPWMVRVEQRNGLSATLVLAAGGSDGNR